MVLLRLLEMVRMVLAVSLGSTLPERFSKASSLAHVLVLVIAVARHAGIARHSLPLIFDDPALDARRRREARQGEKGADDAREQRIERAGYKRDRTPQPDVQLRPRLSLALPLHLFAGRTARESLSHHREGGARRLTKIDAC